MLMNSNSGLARADSSCTGVWSATGLSSSGTAALLLERPFLALCTFLGLPLPLLGLLSFYCEKLPTVSKVLCEPAVPTVATVF